MIHSPHRFSSPADGDRWRPAPGDSYFVILGDGAIHRFTWQGTPFDERAWTFGNCFRAWTEAVQARAVLHEVLRQRPQPLSHYCARHQQYYASFCVYCGPPALPVPAGVLSPAPGAVALPVRPQVPPEPVPVTFVCRHCGRPRRLLLAAPLAHPFPGSCACGVRWALTVEQRHDERRPVRLPGAYVQGATHGRMRVDNLSRGGLGFRTEAAHRLQVNDRLTVRFHLAEPPGSEIQAAVVIRWVAGAAVGAAFLDGGASGERPEGVHQDGDKASNLDIS